MASIFDGMFDSPEDIKNKRMQDIMDAQTRLSQSGGSMSQLLGQVAGQGLLTGRKLGEIGGSMAGLSSRSENKAAELQAMMLSIDPNNPNDLANMAKMMNELGYIKEAIAILTIFILIGYCSTSYQFILQIPRRKLAWSNRFFRKVKFYVQRIIFLMQCDINQWLAVAYTTSEASCLSCL